MNQAQSRRLRMRCLLLLAPLLMASTPSPFPATRGVVLAAAPTRLVFLPLPPEITKGQCVPVTVEAQDGSGAPASPGGPLTIKLASNLLGGTFFASNTCQQSAISSVVLPGNAERAQVWFKAGLLGLVTLTASDGQHGMTDALSLPISVVLNPTSRLVFTQVPPSATAGQPVNVTVEARDALGFVATGYAGTIEFTSTDTRAQLPQRYTFAPATDRGRKTFPITFGSGGIWELVAQDIANPSLRAHAPTLSVRDLEAVRLDILGMPPEAFRGTPLTIRVLATDANGNPGRLDGDLTFSSGGPGAQLPPVGPLQSSYTVIFDVSGVQTLTVTAPSPSGILTAEVGLTVHDFEAREVVVTPSASHLPTCETVTLTLQAVDTTPEPTSVSLCKSSNSAATAIDVTQFVDAVKTENCVSGSFVGNATVIWENKVGQAVDFTLYGATSNAVTVSWMPELDPELTSFSFQDASEQIPKLRVGTGERLLQLNLSDTCPQPLALPPDRLSFSATPPLSITPSFNADTPGQWTVTVRLPECPADPSKPLAIWPMINGTELLKPGGGRVERRVEPKCPAIAEVAILSPASGGTVKPGELVELEVELSNKGQQPILNGVLMVSAEGLNVLEARLDGESLTQQSGGFVIPELLPGAKVKVKVKAQAKTNEERVVNARVWYADEDGAELTPQQTVDLAMDGPGVNVGCGCQTASLPSQLWPWLALLLAASRPWDRSHRLRRGERIDR